MDVSQLQKLFRQGTRPKYLFFWGHRPEKDGRIGKGCLSQWWPATFVINGVAYPTAEHFMMAEKARLFGDDTLLDRIMVAGSPAAAKKLGREVRNFDESVWEASRERIVVSANAAKFEQNEALGAFLRTTGNRVLVEASPTDRVWGIGLAADDPRTANPLEWRGLNLLGFALMRVRDRLTSLSKGDTP
jgi:ribA/ribD-fused uncharacterized protein